MTRALIVMSAVLIVGAILRSLVWRTSASARGPKAPVPARFRSQPFEEVA